MLTSRRDYLLRLIDEVGRILGMVIFKRRAGADEQALETVVVGFERLFGLEGDQIFRLTPDDHFKLLVDDDSPEFARDKVLLYAALSAEAGEIYSRMGNPTMARATRINALRFALKARSLSPRDHAAELPGYAPDVPRLIAALADEPLDEVTAALVKASDAKI